MASERPRLRRVGRDDKELESFSLFALLDDPLAQSVISDERRVEASLDEFREHVTRAAANPIVLHGWRTQAIFAGLVASLGSVDFLKEEDRGQLYVGPNERVRVPDFRLRTATGEVWLIEVKNHHPRDPTADFAMKSDYLASLRRYGDLSGAATLKFAIYWSRWQIWTLTDAERFEEHNGRLSLSLPDASKANELSALGDLHLGTEYPLTFKVVSDPARPRSMRGDKVAFTIHHVEVGCRGHRIVDEAEESLGIFLMLTSPWPQVEEVEIVDDELVSITYSAKPEEPAADQTFQFHGTLSTLYSRWFAQQTLSKEGEITALDAFFDADLGSLVPNDYRGSVLRVWRIRVEPSSS